MPAAHCVWAINGNRQHGRKRHGAPAAGKEKSPPPQGVVEKDRKKPGWRNRSKCCVKNTPAEAGQYPGKSISGPDLVCRYHRKYRQLYQKSGKNRNVPAASRHERHQHPEKAGIKNSDIIYKSQEDRQDILEYINIILFKKAKQNQKYLNCINIVEDTKKRLRANSNYNMTIDNMIMTIWEEIH